MKLVSIIIPNYNRANLIGETLESIQNQTYSNWECIIVDDGSTDNSEEIIKEYFAQDERFSLYKRPKDYPKGANACRNIGLTKLKGEYVIFFDSDDLMLENHLEVKVKYLESDDYDFVVCKSEYFNNPDNENPMNYREINSLPITADNFITKKINWITFDPIIKKVVATAISFTEKEQSAEEYNYFCKLVLKTEKAKFVDVVVTKRRFHQGSYQVNIDSKTKFAKNQFFYFYDTYLDVKNLDISDSSREYLMMMAIFIYEKHNKYLKGIDIIGFYKNIMKEFGFVKGVKKIFQIQKRFFLKTMFSKIYI